MFNAKKVKDDIVQWIRNWFEESGPECNAIVGISSGKDSTIVAALCCEALGKDRVIGVMMPDGLQHDIDKSYEVVEYLGIKHILVDISDATKGVLSAITRGNTESKLFDKRWGWSASPQTLTNLPPRIRMATLYAISQSMNGRVSNNCNLSEDWVGYSTRWGDSVGDFSPLSNLTVTEVKEIGRVLGLPDVLVDKVPIDGLCGKTDEENLGFSYAELDRYIREGIIEDKEKKEIIDRKHKANLFNLQLMPSFDPEIKTVP